MHHRFLPLAATLAAIAAPLASQTTTFVNPPSATTVEGTTRISFPFGQGTSNMHYQQICALSVHSAATGLIKQVAWRRDNDTILTSGDYTAWTPDLTVSLSTSPLPAAQMSNVFANNLGKDLAQIHSGQLNWPAVKKNPPGPTGFDYTVPASKPFLYLNTNGDLTIDIIRRNTTGNSNPLFFMDATSESISTQPQSVTSLGAGCSNPAGKNTVLFYGNWIQGAHARVLLYNAANASPTYWALGLAPFAVPFDMAPAGAPGCKVYIDPLIYVPGMTSNSTTVYAGRWEIRQDIPTSIPGGATFYSQFALLKDTHIGNAAGFSVSEGSKVSVGTYVPGVPAHSEAHSSSLTDTVAGLVQQGYAMVTAFTY